jgi:adenylosuccinate synthase
VTVRFSMRVNGIDALALTKLDVLDGLPTISICTAYRCGSTVFDDFPSDLKLLGQCEPVYEELPGWTEPTKGVRTFDALPGAARAYIARLEELTGAPAAIVSTGSDRDETIVRTNLVG